MNYEQIKPFEDSLRNKADELVKQFLESVQSVNIPSESTPSTQTFAASKASSSSNGKYAAVLGASGVVLGCAGHSVLSIAAIGTAIGFAYKHFNKHQGSTSVAPTIAPPASTDYSSTVVQTLTEAHRANTKAWESLVEQQRSELSALLDKEESDFTERVRKKDILLAHAVLSFSAMDEFSTIGKIYNTTDLNNYVQSLSTRYQAAVVKACDEQAQIYRSIYEPS